MTAIDEFRWALTGGRRVEDNTTRTVIERANMGLGANDSWYPYKRIKNTENVSPSTVTPFTDNTIYIYNHGYQIDIGTNVDTTDHRQNRADNLNVRVKVCDVTKGLEDNCVSYDNGTYYKPEGLIQKNADHMRFAVMSYALDNDQSRDGGILRSKMKYVGPLLPDATVNSAKEFGADGLLINNPESASEGDSGVINYVNKFGANGYKSHDPVSELYYECVNYYKHRGRTPEYANGLSDSEKDGFPAITVWDDPIQHWCQPNFIVGINDANPWQDKSLPGTYFTASAFSGHTLSGSDYGEPGNADHDYSVTDLTNTVGQLEGLNGTYQDIGCTFGNCNAGTLTISSKYIPGLGEVMGTSPAAQKENSYYVAGLAYYAHTNDLRSDLEGKQTISTFMIDTQEYSANPLVGRMNMLWLTGKYGGFTEKDELDTNNDGNTFEPNAAVEWDANGDGEPDNYVLATDPAKLINGLTKVFSEISKQSSSATVAAVISGSRAGQGAVYQSVFFPEYSDTASPANKITWAGLVFASFVDSDGRMREDTNQNHILDDNDKVLVFIRSDTEPLAVEKYSIVGALPEITEISLSSATSLANKYFGLETVGESFYVWFYVDGEGVDPEPSAFDTGIAIPILSGDSASAVASKTVNVLDSYGVFHVTTISADTIAVTNAIPGDVPNASSGTSGLSLIVSQQGSGETEHLDFTGIASDIKYLWASSSWLNAIGDSHIIEQRDYDSVDNKRYIFTFIDENKNGVADADEQIDFEALNAPSTADLKDSSKLFPYIPVNGDTKTLPSYVDSANLQEFLKVQTLRVVNYTRGLDQQAFKLPISGNILPAFRSRTLDLKGDDGLNGTNGVLDTTWRLGDIVDSSPTVVSKPQEALHLLYKDESYARYAEKYSQRRTVLYTGGNDGMMHAFNGGFYEDRFDVYPTDALDNKKDVEYLLQPKNTSGSIITTGYSAHPLGSELWAYVPYNLLPHLYWPTEPNYGHVYFVDLKPRVFDAKIFAPDTDHPEGWGTVLVGGMRFGGGQITVDMDRTDGNVDRSDRTMSSAFFVLDITNPEVAPKVLGEITFPNLGYTTCYPTVVAMKDKTSPTQNDWYLVFGSGPAETDGSPGPNALKNAISYQKAKLYVVDLVKLAKDKTLQTLNTAGNGTTSAPFYYRSFDGDKNAFIADPITVDFDLDYKADAVYFGTGSFGLTGTDTVPTWGGKLRRIVIDNNISTSIWDGDSVLLDLESARTSPQPLAPTNQPISAAPTVGADPDGNYWVYFGTGRYYTRSDGQITDEETFYGVKEPRFAPDSSKPSVLVNQYSTVSLNDMYDSTDIEVNSSADAVSGGPYPYITPSTTTTWSDFVGWTKTKKGGWYHTLIDTGERNIGQAALFGDLLSFTTYVPSIEVCDFEGDSYLYALYYLTGTAPRDIAVFSHFSNIPDNHLKRIALGKGLVPKPSVHVGRNPGSTAFIQTGDGGILTIKEDNPGQTKSGKTSWGYR